MLWLPNGETMIFTAKEIEAARERGSEFHTTSGIRQEGLVSATRLAELTDLPRSWLEEAARQGRIPSIMAGKYRRFRVSTVLAALERSDAASK